jgi:hypothetical protein
VIPGRQEDGPPNVAPRYRDVIDQANSLCMQIRATRLREEFAKRMRQTMRAIPYQVHFGVHHCQTQHFTGFGAALEFLSNHVDDEFMPALLGSFHDAERTGLTEDERELTGAILDTRKPRRVR